MRLRSLILHCCIPAVAVGVPAQAITGSILINKKLTPPSVTAAVSVYQRGTTVPLGKDLAQDPIAYEQARVVIYLEGHGHDGGSTASKTPQIQQIDRRFVPDLVVVPVGSTVSFPNLDPIFHNIYSLSKAKAFDLGNYDKGQTRRVAFRKPGIVEIYCHLHPNMQATVVVTPNRWFAQPDRNGQYRIADVPPGRYTLVAWHRSAGFFRRTVIVEEGHDTTADFFIPVDAEPKPDPQPQDNLSRYAGSR